MYPAESGLHSPPRKDIKISLISNHFIEPAGYFFSLKRSSKVMALRPGSNFLFHKWHTVMITFWYRYDSETEGTILIICFENKEFI